jgi:hypothetical protein
MHSLEKTKEEEKRKQNPVEATRDSQLLEQ